MTTPDELISLETRGEIDAEIKRLNGEVGRLKEETALVEKQTEILVLRCKILGIEVESS